LCFNEEQFISLNVADNALVMPDGHNCLLKKEKKRKYKYWLIVRDTISPENRGLWDSAFHLTKNSALNPRVFPIV